MELADFDCHSQPTVSVSSSCGTALNVDKDFRFCIICNAEKTEEHPSYEITGDLLIPFSSECNMQNHDHIYTEPVQMKIPIVDALSQIYNVPLNCESIEDISSVVICQKCSLTLAELYRLYRQILDLSLQSQSILSILVSSKVINRCIYKTVDEQPRPGNEPSDEGVDETTYDEIEIESEEELEMDLDELSCNSSADDSDSNVAKYRIILDNGSVADIEIEEIPSQTHENKTASGQKLVNDFSNSEKNKVTMKLNRDNLIRNTNTPVSENYKPWNVNTNKRVSENYKPRDENTKMRVFDNYKQRDEVQKSEAETSLRIHGNDGDHNNSALPRKVLIYDNDVRQKPKDPKILQMHGKRKSFVQCMRSMESLKKPPRSKDSLKKQPRSQESLKKPPRSMENLKNQPRLALKSHTKEKLDARLDRKSCNNCSKVFIFADKLKEHEDSKICLSTAVPGPNRAYDHHSKNKRKKQPANQPLTDPMLVATYPLQLEAKSSNEADIINQCHQTQSSWDCLDGQVDQIVDLQFSSDDYQGNSVWKHPVVKPLTIVNQFSALDGQNYWNQNSVGSPSTSKTLSKSNRIQLEPELITADVLDTAEEGVTMCVTADISDVAEDRISEFITPDISGIPVNTDFVTPDVMGISNTARGVMFITDIPGRFQPVMKSRVITPNTLSTTMVKQESEVITADIQESCQFSYPQTAVKNEVEDPRKENTEYVTPASMLYEVLSR